MSLESQLSIVIPVGQNEDLWSELLEELLVRAPEAEIILVGTEEIPSNLTSSKNVQWLTSEKGRARQLNCGAAKATRDYLWFLHADSRLSERAIEALQHSLQEREGLHFFDLKFSGDGPRWMFLNSWGTWFRSNILGLPFGDQGFCLSRKLFGELSGFDESLPFAEDYDFVWKIKSRGAGICSTGASLYTSARKYHERGWGRTTLNHLYWTVVLGFRFRRQGVSE